MDIGTEITIFCGQLSRGARPGVERLAVALGATVYEDRVKYTCLPATIRGKSNLVPVTVTLQTNLMCNDEFIVSQVVIDPRELIEDSTKYPAYTGWGLKMSIEDYAADLRIRLTAHLSTFIQEQVLESLTPPPPFNATGIRYREQEIFLKSTGNRKQDKVLAERFAHYAEYLFQGIK